MEEDFERKPLISSCKKRPRAAAADVSIKDQVMQTFFSVFVLYFRIAKEILIPKCGFGVSYFH